MLQVKNWQRFQHYRDRNPPWIKLHFALLSSSDWVTLDDASRVLAIACMLVASRNEGQIDDSAAGLAYLQRVAYLNKKPNLTPLIDCGFLGPASTNASKTLAVARPETEVLTEVLTDKNNVVLAPDAPSLSKNSEMRKSASSVIEFLNAKAGRNFDLNGANADHVVARLKDGETMEDLRAVVAKKCRDWKGDVKMAPYLRPETLFNRTKYASYKGELSAVS